MDKSAIKKYAIWARRELIEKVTQKALQYGIEDGSVLDANVESINGKLLTETEKKQRQALIRKVGKDGFSFVMEEVAYTWFNRFIALRYMELNGYLPSHVKVFSDDNNNFRPQILTEAVGLELDGLDRNTVFEMKENHQEEELYKYLLIIQCNSLSGILPGMFKPIGDYTELLIPDYLLREGSVVEQMVSTIPEEDWTDQVQIIGWLYQYYNSEPKDQVFADLKNNKKISKEKLPAATQLFTPEWIVRYMVENSLGRLFIQKTLENSADWVKADENRRISMEEKLASDMGWKYYLVEAKQREDVRAKLIDSNRVYKNIQIEDIKIIDPCMGSGHILVYAFDVLMQIYTALGWSERDAAKSILENNIYGLDVDDRAGQLASFAVMMKARKYNRRIFNLETKPNVMAVQDSAFITEELIEYVADGKQSINQALKIIRDSFSDAKEYGSIIEIADLDLESVFKRIDEIRMATPTNVFEALNQSIVIDQLYPIIKQAKLFEQRYAVVVTNPPYAAVSGLSDKVQSFVKNNFPNSKSDLFAVFIERCSKMLIPFGYQAMITQHSWMFIASYEKLRKNLFTNDMINMAHLGARAFEEIAGEVVQTTSFVIRKSHNKNYKGKYCRLIEPNTQDGKEELFLEKSSEYEANQDEFSMIPGAPVAYWMSPRAIENFSSMSSIGDYGEGRIGLITGDANRFLRLWTEVDITKVGFDIHSNEDSIESKKKWFPSQKGGEFRKWYGNLYYVVNWENDGYEMKFDNYMGKRVRSHNYNGEFGFKRAITWTTISTGTFACRFSPDGFMYDTAGPFIHVNNEEDIYSVLAVMNSCVADFYLKILNPTINFPPGYIQAVPYTDMCNQDTLRKLGRRCVELSRQDWDSFESSWNFKKHPLIQQDCKKIEDAFKTWEQICIDRFDELKQCEIEINKQVIDIYGLSNEISCEVLDADITVNTADIEREIKSFISYAVGCMFGRYSLDEEGLSYAGGEWNHNKYERYIPDRDNIIPICDDEYFEDDIVGYFVKFVETVYGKETLEENLRFIANVLGGKGTSREVIRNYFLNDFYKDHCKQYQKKPIYWLADSGKNNGFKCLIYLHRYQPDTIARIRTDYVHEQQARYRTAIEETSTRIESASGSDKVKLTKKLNTLIAQNDEIHIYEEKIHHLADQMISIDLDDGVKKNYEIFKDVLAKIK